MIGRRINGIIYLRSILYFFIIIIVTLYKNIYIGAKYDARRLTEEVCITIRYNNYHDTSKYTKSIFMHVAQINAIQVTKHDRHYSWRSNKSSVSVMQCNCNPP